MTIFTSLINKLFGEFPTSPSEVSTREKTFGSRSVENVRSVLGSPDTTLLRGPGQSIAQPGTASGLATPPRTYAYKQLRLKQIRRSPVPPVQEVRDARFTQQVKAEGSSSKAGPSSTPNGSEPATNPPGFTETEVTAVAENIKLWEKLSPVRLTNLDTFWKAVITKDPKVFPEVPTAFKKKAVCLKAVELHGENLLHIPDDLLKKKFILRALRRNPAAIEHLTAEKPLTWSIWRAVVKKDPKALQRLPSQLTNDQTNCLTLICTKPEAFKWLPDRLKADENFCRKALKANAEVFAFLPPAFQKEAAFQPKLATKEAWSKDANLDHFEFFPPSTDWKPAFRPKDTASDSDSESESGDWLKVTEEGTLSYGSMPKNWGALQKACNEALGNARFSFNVYPAPLQTYQAARPKKEEE